MRSAIMPLRQSGLSLLWLVGVLVVVDQLTKWWAVSHLVPYEPIQVFSIFNFTLAFNYGAAFSFLGDAGGWQRWFFILLATVVSVILVIWLAKTSKENRPLTLGLVFVLAGAIGNLIDRVSLNYVVDFLDFHWSIWHYPTFNIADVSITSGAVLLIWDAWKTSKEQKV